MGNLNDNALPQMEIIIEGASGGSNSATYLPYIEQAVYELNRTLDAGFTVTIVVASYELTPAPAATSPLWNVIANGAVLLYHQKLLRGFLDELQGLDSVRDDVTTYSRRTTMREKRADVEEQQKKYNKTVSDYKRVAGDGGSTMDEIALREDV